MGFLRRGDERSVTADAEILAMATTRRGARETGRRDGELVLELRLWLDGVGRGPAPVLTHACRVPWDKTPRLGQRVPIVLPDGDTARLRVVWDRVPSLTASALAAGDAARRGDAAGAASALGFSLREE